MNGVIISDVHLGSRYCLCGPFVRFIRGLPPDVALILSGDIVDRVHTALPEEHARALDLLRSESECRRVIWIRGNHDERYEMEDSRQIEFVPSFRIGDRLFVSHGYEFDNIRPKSRWLVAVFQHLHELRMRLGCESVHVAFYAKKFAWLYAILRWHVATNAVAYATQQGFAAVATGHTHYAEDRLLNGVRLLNTGAWTETPIHALWVDECGMQLREVCE